MGVGFAALPVVTAGVGWSEERHAAFPPAFRRAALALLLASHRLATAGCAPRLTTEELSHILRLASQPLLAWVPELRPFLSLPAPSCWAVRSSKGLRTATAAAAGAVSAAPSKAAQTEVF